MQEMQLQTLDFAAIARTDGQDRSKNTAVPDEVLSEHPESTFAAVFGEQSQILKPEVKKGGDDAIMPGVAIAAGSGQRSQTSAKDMFDGLAGVSSEGVTPNDDSSEAHDAPGDSIEPDASQFDAIQTNKTTLIQNLDVKFVDMHSTAQGGDQPNIAFSGPSSEPGKNLPLINDGEVDAKDGIAHKPTGEIADLSVGEARADFPEDQIGDGVNADQKTQDGSGRLGHPNQSDGQDGMPQVTASLNHIGTISSGQMVGQDRSFDVAAYKNDSLKSTVENSKIQRLESSWGGGAAMSRNETAPLDMNFALDDTVSNAEQTTISKAVEKPGAPPEATANAHAKLAISSVLLQADTTIDQTSEAQSNGNLTLKGGEVALETDLIGPKGGTDALKGTADQAGRSATPSGSEKTTLTPLMSKGVPESVSHIEAPKIATPTSTIAQQNTLHATEGIDQSVAANIVTQQNSGNTRVGRHGDADATERTQQDDGGTDTTTRITATPGASSVAPQPLAMSSITPLTNAEAEELKAGVEGISERLGEHAHVLSAADRANDATSSASMATKADLPTRVAMQLADAARQLPDRPVEITLSPEELGKVRLSFQLSESGAMHVVIAAERGETLDLLRRNIDSLMSEFRDLGYENSGFSFQSFDQGSQGGDQQKFDSFGGTSAESLTATPPVTSPQIQPVRLSLDATSGMDLRL
jgi:hypothetical protein